ncbi:MAG: hypothetical protein E7163_00405 [Firmicutes bacterium]|nr:hypothetical protein [Bacillota bacterium]
MKQNVKVFFVALIIGIVSSYIFCYKYDNTIITNALESKVTYFCVGSYNNMESANNKKNNYKNALIYNKDGIYKVIIGVYKEKESIELMESYFIDKDVKFTKETMKASVDFLNVISNYELLIKTSDRSYYENINNSLLKLFNEYINV